MPLSSLTTGPCLSLVVTTVVFCCGPPAKPSMKNGTRNQLKWKRNTIILSGVWPSVQITVGSSVVAVTTSSYSTMSKRNFSLLFLTPTRKCILFSNSRKLLYSFGHSDEVNSISLQPGTNGNNLATACDDGIFRLFDTRRSTTGQSELKSEILLVNIFTWECYSSFQNQMRCVNQLNALES